MDVGVGSNSFLANIPIVSGNIDLSDTSGLVPINNQTPLTSVVSSNETVASHLAPTNLSHVRLTSIDGEQQQEHSDDRHIVYEPYFIDPKNGGTSVLIRSGEMHVDERRNSHLNINQKFVKNSDTGQISPLLGANYSSIRDHGKKNETNSAGKSCQKITVGEKKKIKRLHIRKQGLQRVNELDKFNVLRQSNDTSNEDELDKVHLREKRARRAEAARQRYQRMNSEERRLYNQRRRLRQLGLQAIKKSSIDEEKIKQHIIEQNAKKAEAARLRYHRMSDDEKRIYNQRRTEAFRRRRIEEEILLSTPAGRISAEALSKAQQIMLRNAKRAEAARQRYQRMTPEQRKIYNQKRSSAKKAREKLVRSTTESYEIIRLDDDCNASEEALSALERDVIKRTKQAHMVLMRQKRSNMQDQLVMITTASDGSQTIIPATTMEDGKQVFHVPVSSATLNREKQIFHIPVTSNDSSYTSPILNQQISEPVHLHGNPLVSVSQTEACGQFVEVSAPVIGIIDDSQPSFEKQSQRQQSGQSVILTIPEILIADLNQPTGAVLSNGINSLRQHGRPSLYSPTASVIQQKQQTQEQQRGFVPTSGSFCAEADFPSSSRNNNQSTGISNISSSVDILAIANAATVSASIELTQEQKMELQKAKRAERARLRYHRMTQEERRLFNARRASALREARLRDEQLCQLAESVEQNGGSLDAAIMAQRRRARRAEAARLKYHRMTSEERKRFNAARDAQRRRRKRERQATVASISQQHETIDDEIIDVVRDQETHVQVSTSDPSLTSYNAYINYSEQLEHDWTN
ncbi:unnamed protein product [Dracunculus medinensis]|uniref:ALMS_motif domain-containing protein n=1 Tax=Dracunculus medinensis TaxID=318479 RepID=A0A0N4UE42_DRAME|nr:unnamed protein product [Dracunculus medinensis]